MIKFPNSIDIDNLIDNLRIYSWEASDCLTYYSQLLKNPNQNENIIENDNPGDPVTKADLKVNEIIIKRLKEDFCDIKWEILSEENVKLGSNKISKNVNWLWILDPLDGTKDFIQETGNYAMHLALNYRKKPLIGVVLIPEKEELWLSNGEIVWCEKRDGSKIKPKLSKNDILQNMVCVTSKNHRNPILKKLIEKINFKEVKAMGSIGCKIASIARGESDIYISLSLPGESSPRDWDFAAPEAILKAAGGAITNLENEELSYGELNYQQSGIIIASNNISRHKYFCAEIKEIIKRYELFPI